MRFISSTNIQWVSGLILSLFSFFANSQNIHISHCFSACPRGDVENKIVVRHLYASEINRFSGIADLLMEDEFPTLMRFKLKDGKLLKDM